MLEESKLPVLLRQELVNQFNGDEKVNAAARRDAKLATEIAHFIKPNYEMALEYLDRLTETDPNNRLGAAEFIISCLKIANQRAEDLAIRLGAI